MEIRQRLTLQFLLLVAVLLSASSFSVYFIYADIRDNEFYDRLQNKAELVAQMLIDIDEIDARILRKIEKNNPLNLEKQKIVIYNFQNKVIYSTDKDAIIPITQSRLDKVRINKQIRFTSGDYKVLGFFYTGRYDRIVVFAAAVDTEGADNLRELLRILVIVFILGLAVASISGHIFASRALQPIVEMIQEVDSIGANNLHSRIDEGNHTDEMARLAQTFNGMLNRIEDAFKIQKNFIANASHEMRTPLTVISGQLEVVLMNPRSADDYKTVIQSVLDDMRLLNHLSNRLLLLAQANSEFVQTNFRPVRLDDVLWSVCGELIKHRKEYKTAVNFPDNISDEAELTVRGSEILLRTALYNIFENGCKYSPQKAVQIDLEVDSNVIRIVCTDEGIGIPLEEQQHIFEPFYRAANTINIKGHGIGLSLAKKIVELHRGTILLESSQGKGAKFTVELPTV